MQWRNQSDRWGLSSVLMHWLVAVSVLGLFGLGWWMTGLGYYDPWYKQGPFIHKSIGLLVAVVVVLRVAWRFLDTAPLPLASHARWEQLGAKLAHSLLYLLLLVIFISGYLISTADGRPISVFDWFHIPATVQNIEEQEDRAGLIHWYATCSLMALVAIHMLGALKHHLLDGDATLKRMLGIANSNR